MCVRPGPGPGSAKFTSTGSSSIRCTWVNFALPGPDLGRTQPELTGTSHFTIVDRPDPSIVTVNRPRAAGKDVKLQLGVKFQKVLHNLLEIFSIEFSSSDLVFGFAPPVQQGCPMPQAVLCKLWLFSPL